MSEHRMVYFDHDLNRVCYRASSFGGCDRALVAARLDYDPAAPPEALQRIFDAGHEAEEWLTANHVQVDHAQETVTLDVGEVSIVGHIDGYRDGRVVEIKSQSPAEYERWTPDSWTEDPLWRKYAWQTSIYMHALGCGLELVRVRRPTEEHLEPEFSHHFYEKPFHTVAEIYDRVALIERYARDESLPSCTTTRLYGCPYYQFHEGPELIEDTLLDEACHYYRMLQTEAKELDAKIKAAKERVMGALGERGEVETLGGWKVKQTTFEKKGYEVKARTETRLTVTERES